MSETETFELEERWLCPDGACTGLLGADGKCKVCGTQGEVPTPYRDAQAPMFKAEEPPPQATAQAPAAAAADEGWDDRQLCPDGSCTGLIGPDGKCKVCGRTLE